jgi:hypothetical protein
VKAYIKLVLVTLCAMALSAALEAARAAPAQPEVVVLPSSAVLGMLNYMASRPYQEVAAAIGAVQRCLQDQVPDDKGNLIAHGACPEITASIRRLNAPMPHEPPPKK